jgi:hypothetical protein
VSNFEWARRGGFEGIVATIGWEIVGVVTGDGREEVRKLGHSTVAVMAKEF